MIQWDETSPRPYSRHNLVQGTLGAIAGFPTRIALEGGVEGATDSHHRWAQGEQLDAIYEQYEHPMYKRLGALATKMGGTFGGFSHQNGRPWGNGFHDAIPCRGVLTHRNTPRSERL